MKFEQNGQAEFEDGDIGIQERLALGLPEDAPSSIKVTNLASLVLPGLREIVLQRHEGKPVSLHVMGILQAIASDLNRNYPEVI
ncbi:MAG: hypothetical protein WC498_02400 [Candidatus Saccharimonadales bacterium]